MSRSLKPNRSQNHLNRTDVLPSISIVIDEKNKFHLPLRNLRTLTDLRTAIGECSIVFTLDDHFTDQKNCLIDIIDEKKVQIRDILDSTGTIHIRHYVHQHNKVLSRSSVNQRFHNSSAAVLRDQYPVVNVSDISTEVWKRILENNSIFRGRIIRTDGPDISHRRLFHMKSGWKMSVFPKDKIEWREFSTEDQTEYELRRGKIWNLDLGAKGPVVGLENEFERSKQQLSSSSHRNVYRLFEYDVPRAVCALDKHWIEFEPEFLEKIDRILNNNDEINRKYEQLSQLFNEYGNYCAMKFVLGGQIVSYSVGKNDESTDEIERKEKLLAHFKMAVENVELSAGVTRQKSMVNDERRSSSAQLRRHEKIGGDTLKQDKDEWLQTLNNIDTWRVIEYLHLEPIYRLLDDDRQQRIEQILHYLHEKPTERLSVPQTLEFNSAKCLYEIVVKRKDEKKEKITYSFFYVPSEKQWIWNCTSRQRDAWWPIDRRAHGDKIDSSVEEIFGILQRGNVYPPEDIIQQCRSFEVDYRLSSALHLSLSADGFVPIK